MTQLRICVFQVLPADVSGFFPPTNSSGTSKIFSSGRCVLSATNHELSQQQMLFSTPDKWDDGSCVSGQYNMQGKDKREGKIKVQGGDDWFLFL